MFITQRDRYVGHAGHVDRTSCRTCRVCVHVVVLLEESHAAISAEDEQSQTNASDGQVEMSDWGATEAGSCEVIEWPVGVSL